MKKFLLFISLVMTAVIILVVGVRMYTDYQADKYDSRVIPYLETLIPEISTWQEDLIREKLAFRARKQIDSQRLTTIITGFSRLGELKSFETPVFKQATRGMTEREDMYRDERDQKMLVTYTCEALYENGPASMTFILADRGDHFDLHYFNIQSEALLRAAGG